MKELSFLFQKKVTVRWKNKIIFALTGFVTKTELFIHFTYLTNFNRLMFNKTKNKNKKCFCRCCLQCFSSENVLTEHKENCFVINGKRNVKLEKGSMNFKNYSKQLPARFKINADFECLFRPTSSKNVKSSDKSGSYTKNIKIIFLAVLLTKFFVLNNKFKL